MDRKREVRSFLMARDPSIDRRFRPRPDKKVRLFNEIDEGNEDVEILDASSDDESGTASDASSWTTAEKTTASSTAEDAALVYLRLRPVDLPSSVYTIAGNTLVTGPSVESASTSNNKNSMEKHYNFSSIFAGGTKQKDVYEKCVGSKIELEENFTILTYGTSGSGKTFTLLGDEERPGIIPRSLENIFTHYASNIYPHPAIKLEKARVSIQDDQMMAKDVRIRNQLFSASTDMAAQHGRLQQTIQAEHAFPTIQLHDTSVMIWLSFVEIYNENVYDLLTPPSTSANSISVPPRSNLRIVGNDGKVFVKGLTSVYVKSSLEALKLLRYGLQRVNYASTSINDNSSRSHCILMLDILKYQADGTITETSYKFCDLAGSERLDKTGNVGSRLKEAQRINTSLLVLGRCLDSANNNSKKKGNDIIPVRESKLTMLLQAALLGKEKLTMIVNVTPTDAYYEENLNVLCFASIAKNIIFKRPIVKHNNSRFSLLNPPTNQNNQYIDQLLEENLLLRGELSRVEEELARVQDDHVRELSKLEHEIRNELVDSFQTTVAANKKQFEWALQQELDLQKRKFEAQIATLSRKYEEEIEDLREELDEFEREERQPNNDKENVIDKKAETAEIQQPAPKKMRESV